MPITGQRSWMAEIPEFPNQFTFPDVSSDSHFSEKTKTGHSSRVFFHAGD